MKLPSGVEAKKVFGWEEPLKPGKLELPLGDFSSGEERVLLVKFKAAASAGPIDLRCALTYDDVAGAHRINAEVSERIPRAKNASAEKTGPVLQYAQIVEAVDKIALAVQGMDRRLAAEVVTIREKQFPSLKKAAWASRDQDFVNKAYMFEHYARELQDLIARGALHEHSKERAKLQKDLHYRRHLMEHHRHRH